MRKCEDELRDALHELGNAKNKINLLSYNNEMLKKRVKELEDKARYWHEDSAAAWDKCEERRVELVKAVGFLRQGKKQFAPNTTNSFVDDFLKKHEGV